jgi:poly(3-hydroxybutyrate) depolymerase
MGLSLVLANLWPTDVAAQVQSTPARSSRVQILKIKSPTECLVLAPVGRHGRLMLPVDAVLAEIAAGKWTAPKAEATVSLPGGPVRKWETLKAAADGSFSHPALRGGYAYVGLQAEEEQVMILEASGHLMAYVNGEPRAGDSYGYGYVHLPILLRKGTNDLLFHVSRGRLNLRLAPVKGHAQLQLRDNTLPDLISGQPVDAEAAVVVISTKTNTLEHLALEAKLPGGASERTLLPSLPLLSTRKVAFRLRGPAPEKEGSCSVELKLLRHAAGQWQEVDSGRINLRVVAPGQTHKRTFRSAIDGSVQYCALVPAKEKEDHSKPALVLTLHGAAVEALRQAQSYAPKAGIHLVAPTNRRPYGFDWEDWGRLDALEVLNLAQRQLDTDPRRTYLTGHSMGGHGVWHLGATYPDRFAAIGASAGWISMWSYAGAPRAEHPNPAQEMLLRAISPSDTLALARNYTHNGVYILHGDKDDNVPVQQARAMRQALSAFHRDLAYFEEPGAGHWWGKAGISGAACVDWPPMFEFFARHTLPEPKTVRQVDFITASPGVSAWSHWAGIEAQIHPLKISSVNLRYEPETRRLHGTTENVARFALDIDQLPASPIAIELDGQKLVVPEKTNESRIRVTRKRDHWQLSGRPSGTLKSPERYGPFKEAFANRVQFVYGTKGTAAENAWALARARFDAETFWYRGNASVDVLADSQFDPAAEPDRNVILYGHADCNGAWKALLAESPVQVRRGRVRVGDREEKADTLGCLFIRPRPGSDRALVGVVSGTGLPGMRLTTSLPYFISGVGYPDCLILGTESLLQEGAGIRAVGFFGVDWALSSGDFFWGK